MLPRLIALALAFLCLTAVTQAAPSFPPLTGRVVDNAHVLSADVIDSLTGKLKALEDKTGRQLVVVTLPSLQGYEIEDYGYQLGRAWGIGQKGKNDGALFIIVPSEKHVRIEVGYGLEPILTDALSEVILQSKVLPKFRAGDIPGGIVDGTDAIIEQLSLDAPAAKARVAQAAQRDAGNAPHFNPVVIFFLIMIGFSILRRMFGGTRSSGLGWALPLIFMGSGRGGWSGGDSFGGSGFGGSGGGGFSGGGGSFGGGGASGSW